MNSVTTDASVKDEENVIEGLVLMVQDYKESDGIIRLAREHDIIGVLARGIQKSSSKNRRLAQPFSKVRLTYEPQYSRDLYYLITGTVIWDDFHINEDLLAQSVCFVLRDLILDVGINSWIYEYLENCWKAFNDNNTKDAWMYSCLLMASLLKKAGVAPSVDACASCGRTDQIETIVKSEGGFLCHSCNKNRFPKKSRNELRAFRALFKARPENVPFLKENFSYTLQDFMDLVQWYVYYTDCRLPSLEFLDIVCKMESKAEK